jgi:cyclopropane fatty-acyl-phospholipid synthase-like methyltransferase
VDKPYAEAAARNAAPILGVLRHELQGCASLFEIGSGTGQHAVTFAAALPELAWQTSDLEPSHAGIRAWIADAGLENVLAPIGFDVLSAEPGGQRYDAVYSANTAHIMSNAAVYRMFELVGAMLNAPGVFCLYGPFSRGGAFSTPSNEAFDTSLRARNSAMGIRDLDDLEVLAGQSGMELARVYAMPANNLLLVWVRKEF